MREPIDRREFVQRSVAALGAAGLLSREWEEDERLARVGVQLYTLRDEMQKDVDATLARVASIGYREVEFAGYFGKKPAEIAALLKTTGLRAPSAHFSLEDIRNRWPQTLDAASEIGHDYVVCAFIGESERNAEGYKKIAEEFNRAAEQAKAHKLSFAYHNHAFEFDMAGSGKDAMLPYEFLLRTCDAKLVKLEMDLYWITKAGRDPLTYFARYPGRFPLVHVKDMGKDGDFADVGTGGIPFKRYFARRQQAGIKHFYVEHDRPGNAFASIERSYTFLKKLTF